MDNTINVCRVERNEDMKLKMRLLLGDYKDNSENKGIRTVRVKSKKVLKGMFPFTEGFCDVYKTVNPTTNETAYVYKYTLCENGSGVLFGLLPRGIEEEELPEEFQSGKLPVR